MTIYPGLKHALDTGAPIPEVIKIFREHHCGTMEEHRVQNARNTHNDHEFWDSWSPLFRCLPIFLRPWPEVIGGPFLNIHKTLTKEVISWICDSKRKSNVYLIAEQGILGLHGLAHTRAAVLGSICSDARRFGQVIGYPSTYSLSAGLAKSYPAYRRILTKVLVENPRIRELPLHARFKKLIFEPWRVLQESHPEFVITPPVIVLRLGSKKQEELIRSICELGSSPLYSSLLWVVSVNPKIKLPIKDLLVPSVPFRYFRLPICYSEGPVDVALVFRFEFSALRQKHKEIFDDEEMWPSEEQMSRLIKIVSGVFEFVDVIIQFIDWKDDGGPQAHLETFLAYMVDAPSPSDEQPYCALDHFYTHALSSIPQDLLFAMKKAFGIIRFYDQFLDQAVLVYLLSVGNSTFLPHLRRLATIEADEWHDRYSCRSFQYFLEDSHRSGQFYTPKSESRLHALHACLRTLSHSSSLTTILKPRGVPWIQADLIAFHKETRFVRGSACYALCHILGAGVASLLQRFDFRCLAHTCDKFRCRDFTRFLRRLYVLDKANSPNIVRVKPVGPLDRQFIDKCEGLAEPLVLEGEEQFHLGPMYVLLGYGNKTVLAVIASRDKYGKSFNERFSGVNIYTSAMLDYM